MPQLARAPASLRRPGKPWTGRCTARVSASELRAQLFCLHKTMLRINTHYNFIASTQLYNSVHLRKEMYGSKPNGYRTVETFRTAFTFSELAGLDVTTRSTQFS